MVPLPIGAEFVSEVQDAVSETAECGDDQGTFPFVTHKIEMRAGSDVEQDESGNACDRYDQISGSEVRWIAGI